MSLHICQAVAISSRSELTHKRDRQRRIAVRQNQHLGVVDAAQRNAEKIADANVDGHLHAVQGTAQNDTLAMKFDLPHAAIRADVVRIEADG